MDGAFWEKFFAIIILILFMALAKFTVKKINEKRKA